MFVNVNWHSRAKELIKCENLISYQLSVIIKVVTSNGNNESFQLNDNERVLKNEEENFMSSL